MTAANMETAICTVSVLVSGVEGGIG